MALFSGTARGMTSVIYVHYLDEQQEKKQDEKASLSLPASVIHTFLTQFDLLVI